MRTFIAVLCVLALIACGREPAGKNKKWVVGTDATLVPMTFINEKGELAGFEVDLIKALAKEAGMNIELVNVEWEGVLGGLITKKYDMVISSVTILDERKRRMAFSIPYLKSGVALVVRKEMEGVNSLEDADKKNLRVGAQVGTTAYFFLEKYPGIQKKGYQLYGHAVADLIKGEIDVVVGESTGTLYYKNRQPEYFKKMKVVGETLANESYGIALRLEDTELLRKVNTSLSRILSVGIVRKLHEKWDLGQAAQVPDKNSPP